MKKFRKIMAVLVAAMMIMATMVPAWAATSDAGRFDGSATAETGTTGDPGNGKYGTITIANAKKDETYTAYRIFDLASFYDTDTATGSHVGTENGTVQGTAATEWYSYVISETLNGSSTENPWWDFIRNWKYTNASGNSWAYAVSDDKGLAAAGTADKNAYDNAYFWYSKEAVSLNGKDNYHIIKANPSMFSNDWDDPESSTTSRVDNGNNDGASAGIDFVTHNNKVVQAFAQEALRYATVNNAKFTIPDKTNGIQQMVASEANLESNGSLKLIRQDHVEGQANTRNDNMTLGYYLVGTTMGTLAVLDTTNKNVTIYEKNDEPGLQKKVLKKGSALFAGNAIADKNSSEYAGTYDDAATWVRNTDADIDDYVQFRTVITAEQGMKNYTLYDVMEQGLTFNNTAYTPFVEGTLTEAVQNGYRVVLERDSADKSTTKYYEIPASFSAFTEDGVGIAAATNYEFVAVGTTGADFIIKFNDAVTATADEDGKISTKNWYVDQVNLVAQVAATTATNVYDVIDVKDGDRIVIYYSAKVNNNAAIWGEKESDNTTSTGDTAIKLNDGTTALPTQKWKDENDTHRNENYTVLTYGDKAYTQWETASVTTYQVDLVKTRNDQQWSLLKDAKFKMYKVVKQAADPNSDEDPTTTSTSWTLGEDKYWATTAPMSFGGTAPAYLYSGDSTTGANAGVKTGGTELVSVETAAINVRGIEAGVYAIEEIEAPRGYDKLAYPIIVEIFPDADNNATFEGDDPKEGAIKWLTIKNNGSTDTTATPVGAKARVYEDTTNHDGYNYDNSGTAKMVSPYGESTSGLGLMGVQIINTTGEELPSTGGMGTTVLYIVGGMMVILAGAYLFFSRRRQA